MGLDARAEALLREIARNPDDNAPRLAFAKHIEAEAPAHAALIVAQCSGVADRVLIEAFRDELPELVRERLGFMLEVEEVPGLDRGFLVVDGWSFEQRDFLAIDPDILFRVAPSGRALYVGGVVDFEAVAARVRRFDTLVLTGTRVDNATARRLAASRSFAHLAELELDTSWLDEESLLELYQSLPALERLTVRESETPLAVIRKAECAHGLRELVIRGSREQGPLDLRGFSTVRNLTASGCVIDAGFASLPNRFHAVELSWCELTGGLRAELHETRVFSKLRELTLSCNEAQTETLIVLLASSHVGPLRSLAVHDDPDHDPGPLRRAASAKHDTRYLVQALANVAPSLEQLAVGLALDQDAQQALAQIPFARLAWLELLMKLTPTAAHEIAAAPWIRGLRELTFDISLLDEPAARALAAALGSDCRVNPLGESEKEVFDAFGIYSEEVPADDTE